MNVKNKQTNKQSYRMSQWKLEQSVWGLSEKKTQDLWKKNAFVTLEMEFNVDYNTDDYTWPCNLDMALFF